MAGAMGETPSSSGPPASPTGAVSAGARAGAPRAGRGRGGRRHVPKDWDAYVGEAERLAATDSFGLLRDEILDRAAIQPGERVLDVGAGTGLLALAAAAIPARVSALDISAAMCDRLRTLAAARGLALEDVVQGSAAALPFPDGSFDAVISNYCLHELSDEDKRSALAEIRRVLRPGGRLAFGDMMFDLGLSTRRDRTIIWQKVRGMLRKGPAGVWRLVRNAARVATGRWEQPVSSVWWSQALHETGFIDISVRTLHHEGGVASARRP
jgi:ubiquinone/menaquinone biosynthesis C-methylase UbiE